MTDLSAISHRRAPANIEDLDIPRSMVEDLFMRRLVLERTSTVTGVSRNLGISMSIGREVADELRDRQLIEYQGLEGRDYRAALTELGNRVALDRARQAGATTVDLTSRPSREAANRLYRRIGFEQRETNVYRYKL